MAASYCNDEPGIENGDIPVNECISEIRHENQNYDTATNTSNFSNETYDNIADEGGRSSLLSSLPCKNTGATKEHEIELKVVGCKNANVDCHC